MNSNFSQNQLKQLLSEGQLRESISYLREAVGALQNNQKTIRLLADLDVCEQIYHHMSEWLFNGYPDPTREEEYGKLKQKIEYIGEELAFQLTYNELGLFYAERRNESISPVSLQELITEYQRVIQKIRRAEEELQKMPQLRSRREELLSKIFRKAWILDYNATDELDFIISSIDQEIDTELMAMLISGLSFGALQYYDRSKLEALLTMYDRISDSFGDERLLARLLVSIILIMHHWRDKIKDDKQLKDRFLFWSESIINYTRLRDVILTLIKTKDTDRVAKKIKEDLLPALMKTSPEIIKKLKEGNGMLDMSEFDENPEWEKFLKESGLQSKLMELNEMQMAGMDVMMQAFAQLKSFPFFREASNWFLPFSEEHSAVSKFKAYANDSLRRVLGDELGFCDGDKYSFVLSLISMPPEKAMGLSSQMEAAFEQMNEEIKSEMLHRKSSVFNTEITKYSRDLYRFSRLYPRRREYPKVFSEVLDFREIPFIGPMMTEPEVLEAVGQFYFSTGYYSEALSLFENMAMLDKKDRPLLEKIGYCYQVAGDYAHALENYEKADLFSSDAYPTSLWLLKKLALCHKILGNNEESASYYSKAIQKDPTDLKMRLNYGHLLLNMDRTEEALKEYNYVHYQDAQHANALRSLVRGEMKAGAFDKARKHLDQLLEKELTIFDRGLAGHLSFLEKDYRTAILHYRASRDNNVSSREHRINLQKEMAFLQGGAFDSTSFSILLDEVFRY